MAWYDPTSWDAGDWATVAAGPMGLLPAASGVATEGDIGANPIGDMANSMGGLFSSPDIYIPPVENYQPSGQQLFDRQDLRNQQQYQLGSAANIGAASSAEAGRAMLDIYGQRDQMVSDAQAQQAWSNAQADALVGQSNNAATRDQGFADPTMAIAGQYGREGIDTQLNAANTLARQQQGQTTAQQGAMFAAQGLLGQGMGGQTQPGLTAQQDVIQRAQQAQGGRIDTSGITNVGRQMAGVGSGMAVGGQLQSAYDLQQMGQGDIAGQYGGIARLEDYAGQGMGPSAAEAQLRSGMDRAAAQQMALARSGRGAGSTTNLRQAMANAAGLGQQTNQQAAQLRAQEEAAWRQQQLSALNAAQGARGALGAQQAGALQAANAGFGSAASTQLGALQGSAQAQQAAIQAQQAQQAQNLNALGIQGNMAQTLGAQGLQAQGQGMAALQSAADIYGGQAAQQAQAAQAAGQLGAGLSNQQLAATQAGANIAQQQAAMNDAQQLGLLGAAAQQSQLAQGYGGQALSASQGFTGMGQQAGQSNISNQLSANQAATQAGIGFGSLVQSGNEADREALGRRDQIIGNQIAGVQTADAQRDAATLGTAGAIGAALLTGSDVRLKKNIRPDDESPVEALRAFRAAPSYSYDYKQGMGPPGRMYGPMAQDLERTPAGRSAVVKDRNGMRAIDGGRLSLLNASATTNLDDRISRLEKLAGAR